MKEEEFLETYGKVPFLFTVNDYPKSGDNFEVRYKLTKLPYKYGKRIVLNGTWNEKNVRITWISEEDDNPFFFNEFTRKFHVMFSNDEKWNEVVNSIRKNIIL
jgi:hypothetical protein